MSYLVLHRGGFPRDVIVEPALARRPWVGKHIEWECFFNFLAEIPDINRLVNLEATTGEGGYQPFLVEAKPFGISLGI